MKPLFLILLVMSLLGCYSIKKATSDQTQTKQTLEQHHDINQVIDTTKTDFAKVTVTEVDYVTVPQGESVHSDTVKVPVPITYFGSVPQRFKQTTYQRESKQNGLSNNQELIDTKAKQESTEKSKEQSETQVKSGFWLNIILGVLALFNLLILFKNTSLWARILKFFSKWNI